MRIGIDAKWLSRGPISGKVYLQGLLKALLRKDRYNEYIIFLDRFAYKLYLPQLDNLCFYKLQFTQSPLRVFLELSWEARKTRLEILWTQTICSPLVSCQKVVTIHDLLPLEYPQYFNIHERVMIWLAKKTLRIADLIFTPSNFTAEQVIKICKVPPERVIITPHGVESTFSVIRNIQVLERCRKKYKLPDAFFLYVGRINSRKNLLRVLDAFKMIKQGDISLVIVGQVDGKAINLKKEIQDRKLTDSVRWLGNIPFEDLPLLYNLATAFIYVSLAEGFGMPILEAMKCGCPVICSNTTSMPEVAGDAAFLVDPYNTEEIANAMEVLSKDERLRDELRTRGLRRVSTFTWERTAQQILAAFQNLAGEKMS